jgi:hypothetical protein
MQRILSFFSLFGSLSTLLCCALPVALVSIGMGATFASLTSTFPQIIWLTERKEWLFGITAVLLVVSFFLMKNAENLACPVDPAQRDACQASKSFSKKIYWGTVVIYIIGFAFSYIIPRIMY